jgi:hypothetical protein
MKKQFILPLAKAGMTLITKMRSEVNIKYLHIGKQKKGSCEILLCTDINMDTKKSSGITARGFK